MPIEIEDVVERAFEQAFIKALEHILQSKAEALFKKAFEDENSPLARRMGEKIEEGFQRFMENGIRWEKRGTGFKPRKKD